MALVELDVVWSTTYYGYGYLKRIENLSVVKPSVSGMK